MNIDARTKDYVTKRTEEGKSKREIMRCLKRYVAREVYRQITNPIPAPPVLDLRPHRHQLGMTLQQAATNLQTWPSTLSRLERGKMRDDRLLLRYRTWLFDQKTVPAPLPTARDSSRAVAYSTLSGSLGL